MARPAGRNTSYNEQTGEKICLMIETSTRGLAQICKENPRLPSVCTIYRWMNANPKFKERYMLAKDNQLIAIEDEMIQTAKSSSQDFVATKKGELKLNREAVERSKLIVNTYSWLLERLSWRRFGQRMAHTNANGDGPAEIVIRYIGAPKTTETQESKEGTPDASDK